jgi:WD40 repeat protein
VRIDAAHNTLPFPIAQDEPSSPTRRRSGRIQKPPPVTPRRFKRFFAPRVKFAQEELAQARSPLKEVPAANLNVRQNDTNERPIKRRRLSLPSSPVSSSLPSSPLKNLGLLDSSQDIGMSSDADSVANTEERVERDEDFSDTLSSHPKQIVPLSRKKTYRYSSLSGRLLHTRLDGRAYNQAPPLGNELWQHETANFYSSPTDLNWDRGTTRPASHLRQGPALPFCVVNCNANSLVAVCDEDGYVRLMDAGNDCADQFQKTYLSMKPHDNAIMDAAFSPDDMYLATAAGDQTCIVTDVQAQKATWCLTKHAASVKKVLFQPGNPHVLISSARDGDINIWDVRQNPCKVPLRVAQNPLTADMVGCTPSNTIWEAHHPYRPARTRSATDRTEYTITSMAFLDDTRPNLFVTSCDNDAMIRLWDIRSKHSYYSKTVPLSSTAEPQSHMSHRRFGIASIALSSNGSKLYALCRDHTIYAYNTSHLILGTTPEMATDASKWKSEKHGSRTGGGPIYGFRDPAMAITDFYIKLAIRPATDTHPELLAAGSSDNCAVIYPTDERYQTSRARVPPVVPSDDQTHPRQLQLTRLDFSSQSLSLKKRAMQDGVPIYYVGTPLVRGHRSEVTGVAWTNEGNLVTVGDDSATRCWREDETRARFYRTEFEGNVERRGAGWAALRDEGWDDEV